MVEAAVVDERAAAKSVSSHGTTRFADQHRGRQAEGVSCNLAATSFETPAQRHATGPTVSSRLRRTMSAGRLQRTRESSSARSPSNAENPVPCNTSWFKTDLNSPGYATLSLKMGYSKERAHVPWAGPDKALPPPSGGPPDHQTLHLGALSSRNDRARVQEYAARLEEQQVAPCTCTVHARMHACTCTCNMHMQHAHATCTCNMHMHRGSTRVLEPQ